MLNKIAIDELPPLKLASVRFISAGIIIFLLAKILGEKTSITRKQMINCTIAGFLFLSYGNGVFVWFLQYVDSGFAALEASTQPLIVIILMRVFFKRKLKAQSIFGIILGLFGMYLLVNQGENIYTDNNLFAAFMIITCVVSWSIASIFVSRADLPENHFVSASYQMLFGGVILIIASIVLGDIWSSPINWEIKTQISVFGLIIFGSVLAFTAFNYLLKVVSVEKVSTTAYVNPVIALFLGWYILDENISIQSSIAAITLLIGVYFINTSSKES